MYIYILIYSRFNNLLPHPPGLQVSYRSIFPRSSFAGAALVRWDTGERAQIRVPSMDLTVPQNKGESLKTYDIPPIHTTSKKQLAIPTNHVV